MKRTYSGLYFGLFIQLVCILAAMPYSVSSQRQVKAANYNNNCLFERHQADRWYFGNNAGLDFRPQNPVADLTNQLLNVPTSPAIIADSLGDLLFFTDGYRVFNRLGDTMPNGKGLHGFMGYTMPALIIPKPGDNSIYYIFTTHRPRQSPEDPQTIYGLEYNEVNMVLDSGYGEVTTKNIVLLEPEVSSKLSAVKHSNGTDYWVVAHRFNSNEFCSFLVTQDGVDTSGYVSSFIGTVHLPPGSTNNGIGYMKISPDGTKIALAIYGSDIYEIFDFDASTGEVTNVITSPPTFNEAYGIEFSSDSRFLYATITSTSLPQPNYTPPSFLFQFDVSAGNDIFTQFDTIAMDTVGSYFGGIQLGTDGRIYVSRSPYGNAALGVIQNPKREGSACNFVSNGLDLMGKQSRYGFPNFIQTYFNLPHFDIDNTCKSDTTYFFLQNDSNIDSIYWDFGDPESGENFSTDLNPFHIYGSTGNYLVHVTEYFNGQAFGPYTADTIVIFFSDIETEGTNVGKVSIIYPNPGDGNIRIAFYSDKDKIRINVRNSVGQAVHAPYDFKDLKEREEISLNISHLPEGIYFIEVLTDDQATASIKYILSK